ncbi:hypothetical protein KCU64_g3953, partial [Aureobasidium melanogenum]
MQSLPPDFLLTPTSGATVTRIDFTNTPLPEYADLQAFIIDNALTSSGCTTLLSAAEASGTWQRAMIQVGNGRQRQEDDQRKCGRLIWDSPDVAQRIWNRVKSSVPEIAKLDRQAEITGGSAVMRGEVWEASRLNERLRFLRYEGGEYFRVHEDGAYQTPDGSERSFFTFRLYLNGDGETNDTSATGGDTLHGGATTFHSHNMKRRCDVLPKTGRVLIFQHRKLWHSGDDVVQGVKYTIRSDILYKRVEIQQRSESRFKYVHQFFLDDFWNNRIQRFGDGAVNNYKAVGVRKSLVDQLEYNELESPTVKQKQNPLSGAWEEGPEIDSDAEYPDVDEGIIYPNRILTLLGQEMSESAEYRDGRRT